jgi:GC-rich sequence DNA-binding factor
LEDNNEEVKKGKRNVREEDEPSSGEEERVDMSAITGVKELEERREKFYSVQPEVSENDESDVEMHEWENQQIRKGVTGVQLMAAQQESSFGQYMIPSNSTKTYKEDVKPVLTTAELLEQAYSQTNHEISKHIKKEKKKDPGKSAGIKTPQEILKNIKQKLKTSRELNHKHFVDIDRMTEDLEKAKIDLKESDSNNPVAASKYRFYQELKLYNEDLIECLNEKLPNIVALEERVLNVTSKYTKTLIERRRQDIRDQAKELIDTSKSYICVCLINFLF